MVVWNEIIRVEDIQTNRVYNEEYDNKDVNKEHRGEVSSYPARLMMCAKTRWQLSQLLKEEEIFVRGKESLIVIH